MEEVVAAARMIEKILEEQTDTKMERLVSTMQDEIWILKKDLKEANEQIAAHKAAALPANALAAVPAPTVAAAQPPPPAPACHLYQENSEDPPFYHPPRRQMDRQPPRCFLCREEGHFVSNCPARPTQFSNAFFASKHAPAPADCLEDKYWSCRTQRTTPKLIPTYS